MKKTVLLVLTVVMLVSLTSCATVVSDSKYPVTITSNPNEAIITIADINNRVIYQGKTPAVVSLEASNGFFQKASYTIKFEKAGFDDSIYTLTSTLDGWYWGNLLIGGVLGMVIIDPLTGAMWKLDPNVSMQLTEKVAKNQALSLMNLQDIPDEWRGHLIKLG